MRTLTWQALSGAGLLALAASGCAGSRQESNAASPGTQQVQVSQRESEKALKSAHEAQQRATAQEHRAAEAQANVQKAQRELAQAQERAKLEQAKAQQLQQEANQLTQQASRRAQQSQQQAARALSTETEKVQRGEETVSGLVTHASPDAIVVQPHVGEPMTFTVTDETQIRIDGRQASVSDIQQGADARVAYRVSGTKPTALSVRVMTPSGDRTGRSPQEEGGASPGSSTQGTGAPQGTGSSPGTDSSQSGWRY